MKKNEVEMEEAKGERERGRVGTVSSTRPVRRLLDKDNETLRGCLAIRFEPLQVFTEV